MSRLARTLHRGALAAEARLDSYRFRLRRRLGRVRPIQILPYLGHGTAATLYLKGRVLEQKGIAEAGERDTVLTNLRMAYRRFQSDEVPHVRVRARAAGAEVVVESDHEGYFDVRLHPAAPLSAASWHDVELALIDAVSPGQGPVLATGRVQVPPPGADFGIVSDIDDTVLQTGATGFWRMARTTLFHNARTRLPFEGVSGFYKALQQGRGTAPRNPIFYVSSSPWNLYDLLVEFFTVKEIPAGTLFLRDLGFEPEQMMSSRHEKHKLAQIERLFSVYPHLKFILIGDSGQKDPEIYCRLVEAHPDRILAVYIREVTSGIRAARVEAIARRIREHGVEMLLVTDTLAAARHAAARGFIDASLLPELAGGVVENPQPIETVATVSR